MVLWHLMPRTAVCGQVQRQPKRQTNSSHHELGEDSQWHNGSLLTVDANRRGTSWENNCFEKGKGAEALSLLLQGSTQIFERLKKRKMG
jgi:hypothetical protein